MRKNIRSLFLISLTSITTHFLPLNAKISESAFYKTQNSVIASAVGDAMGRVTEFITSTDAIFEKYPNGIRTFDDFTPQDWTHIPYHLGMSNIAPYTDDTRMAKLVLEVLIKAKLNPSYDLNKTMERIVQAFVDDMHDTTYGWAAPFRAPGNATLRSVRELEQKIKAGQTNSQNWWAVGEAHAGGCGSVMHAYPFGLIFEEQKAKKWAAEHSKLTHGHPMTIAACAAMAVGVAKAVHHNLGIKAGSREYIVQAMIEAAQEYHQPTAQKMKEALALAKEGKQKLQKFVIKKGEKQPLEEPTQEKPVGSLQAIWNWVKHLFGYNGKTGAINKNNLKLSNNENARYNVQAALADKNFRAFHDMVFNKFQGWAADDAIAATVYVFALFDEPDQKNLDIQSALYISIHTPGDSDSIGAMAGALIGACTTKELPEFFKQVEESKELKELVGISFWPAHVVDVKSLDPFLEDQEVREREGLPPLQKALGK